jgi:hypothetical protein
MKLFLTRLLFERGDQFTFDWLDWTSYTYFFIIIIINNQLIWYNILIEFLVLIPNI